MINRSKKNINDINKIKHLLIELEFICNSRSSANHLIYTKNEDTIVINNQYK